MLGSFYPSFDMHLYTEVHKCFLQTFLKKQCHIIYFYPFICLLSFIVYKDKVTLFLLFYFCWLTQCHHRKRMNCILLDFLSDYVLNFLYVSNKTWLMLSFVTLSLHVFTVCVRFLSYWAGLLLQRLVISSIALRQ